MRREENAVATDTKTNHCLAPAAGLARKVATAKMGHLAGPNRIGRPVNQFIQTHITQFENDNDIIGPRSTKANR
jgi:hypothetical protein